MLVEFVVNSFLCSETFSTGYCRSPLRLKNQHFQNSNPNFRDCRRRTTTWMCYWRIITIIFFINFFKPLNSLLWVCRKTRVSIWWLHNCIINPSRHCSDLHISTKHFLCCLGYVRERFLLRKPLFLLEESKLRLLMFSFHFSVYNPSVDK